MVPALSAATLLLAATNATTWWKPTPGLTWQIDINSSPVKEPFPNVSVYDIDAFDNPATTVAAIHKSGTKAICYFSAGSWEKWRPDASDFNASTIGKPLDGWPGERWLDTRAPKVRAIMVKRMKMAHSKGCDAVDPDNMDAYANGGGGFGLKYTDAINYMQFLATESHKLGMAVGLKNALNIIPDVLKDVDFAVNEQCEEYSECDREVPFIQAGKPVFEIEYPQTKPHSGISIPEKQWNVSAICNGDLSTRKNFSTVIKYFQLNSSYVACPIPSD